MGKHGRGRDPKGKKKSGAESRRRSRRGPAAIARLQEQGHAAAPKQEEVET